MAEKKEKQYVSDNAQLMAEWNWERNIDAAPTQLTLGSGKKIWWKCNKGHEWEATVDKRSSGKGCPYCSGRLVSDDNRLSLLNPNVAKTWDYVKNNPLTPDDVSFSSNKNYWWICENGHSWQASCNSRNSGNGCPYCSGRIATKENNLLLVNPELCDEWDYDKNDDLIPECFTSHSSKSVWWKCKNGHSYKKSIAKRTAGYGCPVCSNRTIIVGVNDLKSTMPNLANEWNYEKNSPLLPEHTHAGSTRKVWWKCKKGHEWEASIVNRARGRNCPYCAGKIASDEWSLEIKAPWLLKEWDYEKNKPFLPKEYTPYSNKKVWWKCELGHNWYASINKRINGSKCPTCWKEMRTSFPEQCVLFYLKKIFTNVCNSFQFKYNKYSVEFDIFIPEINVAIEYDGEHYHKDKLHNDIKKNMIAKNSGITLYRIRENGCPAIDNCFVIAVDSSYINNEFTSLERAISSLMENLGYKDVAISIENDQHKIFEQYISFRKEHSLAIICPDLIKEWDFEKNGSLNPLNVSFGSAKIVWWKCAKCGYEYKSPVNRRKQGRGCPACAGKVVVEGVNDLSTRYPSIVKSWNYEKNSPLMPTDVMPKSHKKVWWKCEACGYEWEQTIANRTNRNRCPSCEKEK